MQDIRLFDCSSYTEVISEFSYVDSSLVDIIKERIEVFFNIKLLAEKFRIGKGGKIDILGIDFDLSPVILLFQKSANENIITRGIFSYDWITQHKEAFNKLALRFLPNISGDMINWDNVRTLCISGDFSIYDKYAASRIDRNIELIRYRKYSEKFLLFETLNELYIEKNEEPSKDRQGDIPALSKKTNKKKNVEKDKKENEEEKTQVAGKTEIVRQVDEDMEVEKPKKLEKSKESQEIEGVEDEIKAKKIEEMEKSDEKTEGNGAVGIEKVVQTEEPEDDEQFVKASNTIESGRKESDRQSEMCNLMSRIGFCRIKNNKHYVMLPGREEIEIIEIPKAIYLAQGQFVLVSEAGHFRYAYPYGIGENDLSPSIDSFAIINIGENGIYIDKGDNKLSSLCNIPATIQLKDKSIVSVDCKNEFIRFYKPIRHNADSFMASVKAKGHQMVFVLKLLSEGAILRDIETGKEFYKAICSENTIIREEQVVCIQNDKVMASFNSSKFYTLSSYYNAFEYGTVEMREGLAFLLKLTGEKVIIKDAPDNLCTGQVVFVDENNNFCGIEENSVDQANDMSKRNISRLRLYKQSNRAGKVKVSKRVLVLGNNSYANSYKLTFLKYGYKAEVLEGFEPWPKICAELKEVDIVVVVTAHISHDNMWRIKKEVGDRPVIYTEFDGANRILEQLLIQEDKVKNNKDSCYA